MAFLQALLDLFFPPRCPFCGKLLEEKGPWPCRTCAGADFWITGPMGVSSGEHYSRCVSAGWYEGNLRHSVLKFKFYKRPEYAETYGPILAQSIKTYLPGSYDCITWMPVSPETLKKRGYDQAQCLAQETAKALGQETIPLLAKTGKNVPQSSLKDGRLRKGNVSGVYGVPDPSKVQGRRVLLIDDILTTGATLEEGAKTLREAGAAQVVAATLCRTPSQRDRKTQ